MALTENVRKRALEIIETFGESTLHALYPNDFELYYVALELVDSVGKTQQFFAFPVVPNLSMDNKPITNVKKTSGAVVSLKNDTFIPRDITLSGNFGRRLRVLLNKTVVDIGSGWFFINPNSKFKIKVPHFDNYIKTGYGATKLLQAICENSQVLDNYSKPHKLILYNSVLNENHVVEVMDIQFNQSLNENRMYGFNLTLKAIAPLYQIALGRVLELGKDLAFDNINKVINKQISKIY